MAENRFKVICDYFETVKKELKRENRFYNEKLDGLVHALLDEPEYIKIIREGTIFYRARKYTETDAEKRFHDSPRLTFQGYDKENSGPNMKATKAGRCNPAYIPYLYISTSIPCCLSEIEPHLGNYVSVAEIEVKEPLRILSLAEDFGMSSKASVIQVVPGEEEIPDSLVKLYLERFFSEGYENPCDYYMTQYVAEKIKNMGKFDGIAYKSSVYKGDGNVNYTIFNFEKCEPISSKLYRISDIKVEYTNEPQSHDELTEREATEQEEEKFFAAFEK